MLKKYLENPFAEKNHNTQKLLLLTGTHLQCIKALNTNDKFKEMIAALKPKYESLKKWYKKVLEAQAVKKEKPKTSAEVLDSFQSFVKKLHKQVNYFFKDKPEVMQEFFPNGKNEYEKLKKNNAEIVLTRLAETCTKYAADLDEDTATKATNILQEYRTAASKKQQAAKAKAEMEQATKLKEELLALLYSHLLQLLGQHHNEPKAVLRYFEAPKVEAPKKSKK